jgi:hypothetical protein
VKGLSASSGHLFLVFGALQQKFFNPDSPFKAILRKTTSNREQRRDQSKVSNTKTKGAKWKHNVIRTSQASLPVLDSKADSNRAVADSRAVAAKTAIATKSAEIARNKAGVDNSRGAVNNRAAANRVEANNVAAVSKATDSLNSFSELMNGGAPPPPFELLNICGRTRLIAVVIPFQPVFVLRLLVGESFGTK